MCYKVNDAKTFNDAFKNLVAIFITDYFTLANHQMYFTDWLI